MSKHFALLSTQTFPTSKAIDVFLFCLILRIIIIILMMEGRGSCPTNRKVAGSIPAFVIGIFH